MDGKVCKDARIVLGSMAPMPIRCTKAEGMITGKELDEGLIAKCAAKAIAKSSPIDDSAPQPGIARRRGQRWSPGLWPRRPVTRASKEAK